MTNQTTQFIDTFRQEADELLAEIEQTVLELEAQPNDQENVNKLFRAMHTIKGSGSMFGFDEIAAFSHHVETALDKVRSGTVTVNKAMIDLILLSRDHIQTLLQSAETGSPVDQTAAEQIIRGLEAATRSRPGEKERKSIKEDAGGVEQVYRIRFAPLPDFGNSGVDPADILNELCSLGDCQVVPQTEKISAAQQQEQSYPAWDITLTTRHDENAIRDVFIFVQDFCRITIAPIEAAETYDLDSPVPLLGEILVERGDVAPGDIEEVMGGRKKIGELLVKSGKVSPDKIASALKEQKIIDQRRAAAKAATIRVPSEKLDHLVNLVGELVITQARLSQVAQNISDMELAGPVEEVERLTAELRDVVLNIRMLPIGTTFSKFKRLVRDLADTLGKEIELVTEGAETELDKTVIERLNDPLVHLIRNCIDHGIEPPDQRSAKGKPATGMIRLSAAHQGAEVIITIQDDGKGLDPVLIREKSIEKGLMAPDAKLSEKEIQALIFAPGFSTAEQVTNVSGRGVGMDVVKREIDSLGGGVEISSKKDLGTTIRLSLPLTLAIIDGLLVKVDANFFVLPLSMIEECVELTQAQARTTHGRNMIPVRGELVPFIRLREFFDLPGIAPEIEHIAIVQVEDLRVGIVVDHIIGDHQTVIKSLGKVYQNAEGVSGATIMGDGTVALILDIPELVRKADQEEEELIAAGK